MRLLRGSLALRLMLLAVTVGIVTRFVAGVCLGIASAPKGWGGIVTFVVMYGVTFFKPVRTDQGQASVVGIALGRSGAWSRAARWTSAAATVVAAGAIAFGIVEMPQSGQALDVASWLLLMGIGRSAVHIKIFARDMRWIRRRLASRKR